MRTPMMNTTHSMLIAFLRPKKSAVLSSTTSRQPPSIKYKLTNHSRRTSQRTNQRPNTQQTHNQPTPHIREPTRRFVARDLTLSEPQQEILHEEYIGDLAGVVAEDEAAHGGEEGQHDGDEAYGEAVSAWRRLG